VAIVRFRDSGKSITVGKILCLGSNYAEHAIEMKSEVPRAPVVFLKPPTALLDDGEDVVFPPFSRELHHEVEMVVVIGKGGKNIPARTAYEHVAGYAVGLDMTLRDVQDQAKRKGLPWSVAKGFDTSAPVSTIVAKELIDDPHNLNISLRVNGQIRQHSNTNKMIFRIHDAVSYLSGVFTLEPGDLIFTGTPEGVGKVVPGDFLEATLDKVGSLRVRITQSPAEKGGIV
jgi:2-keto-4-pentenoate hydratase/2-oxohepta-3-ene-1,7-dioic acid hydratase in catechol pathway